MKKFFFIKLIAVALLTGMLCGGIYQGVLYLNYRAEFEKQESMLSQDSIKESQPEETERHKDQAQLPSSYAITDTSRKDVSGVAANVLPALVSVQCNFRRTTYDFFGRPYESEESGSASGILMASGGNELLIVTNNHVVENAVSVEVMFVDGTIADAKVKATEPSEDLAVVSVALNALTEETIRTIRIASLGSSDDLKLGQMVIAIGNALGYGQSTTVGYISALNQEVTFDDGTTMELLQTDAAINPGNSGGALLNARGEVIGINNSKLVDSEVEGICYAIPISKAIPIINSLLSREILRDEEKGYIGIIGKDVTKANSKTLNMPVGIYIKEIEEGSPAELAGLKIGNILTAVNGTKVETMEDLSKVLSYTRGGSVGTLTVQVMRDGTYMEEELSITFGYQKKSR